MLHVKPAVESPPDGSVVEIEAVDINICAQSAPCRKCRSRPGIRTASRPATKATGGISKLHFTVLSARASIGDSEPRYTFCVPPFGDSGEFCRIVESITYRVINTAAEFDFQPFRILKFLDTLKLECVFTGERDGLRTDGDCRPGRGSRLSGITNNGKTNASTKRTLKVTYCGT